jgi:hypothetical protein
MIEKFTRLAVLSLICFALAETNAAAQRGFAPQVLVQGGFSETARNTAVQLQLLLRRYPPNVRDVLRLDPSLLTNEQFMAAYPDLKTFLSNHPEILRSPAFYVGEPEVFQDQFRTETRAGRVFEDVLAGSFLFIMFVTVATFLGSLIKMVIDHRRWLRVSKVQSEVHAKLLDRFSASQELLSYIQTPAGRHFLESAPIMTEAGSRPISAPVNRILWSVQVGVVLALAGTGLNYVSGSVIEEVAQPLTVIGVLALALGIGFVLSALVAFVLSRRLGLLNHVPSTSSLETGATPPHA